ncbi:MAG: glycerol-3-phosphate 1-O-acyltransferase PlsB [Proteobacteria bacterium]|nr:glycerol-3-phosphate 1-O-acyltransferase PlsB [Pseudomonadota bacterium]MDA0992725.1 glycerol-3-phosphate 1-O-acyltransferase PlsB [Pseudomonadota bacterium]
MNLTQHILRPWYWLAGKVLGIWARPALQPDDPAAMLKGSEASICYVLESGGLADALALERVCRMHGLPVPTDPMTYCGIGESRRIIVVKRMRGFIFRRRQAEGSNRLKRLIDASIAAGGEELLLVPVGIYWGRSPNKEHSWLTLLFSENWDVAGRTRKFFATVFQGRNTLLRFSDPLPLSSIVHNGLESEVAFRKVSRILRVHFRQRRTATVGPDLSHRRTLLNDVLTDESVRAIIEAESGDNRIKLERTTQKARGYAREIAAHISYPTVRVVERFLGWVWNRIYDGLEIQHVETLHEEAKNNEIVYVPCHRSHVDYLLLSYIVYHQGLSLPHVAAGINLNIPFVGGILRRGGAFYLRRSFKGNRLYAAVFNAYLRQILARGHAIEYFVEGGRSRTGRLLSPKAGMLAMTVNSYIHNPRLPVVFIPVYFGYEKLIEGNSFISEMGGAAKQKESLFGLIRSIKALREYFGKVYVNIGKPIRLNALLDAEKPDWRKSAREDDDRPAWIGNVIDRLGGTIMSEINAAAAVTPISLLAYALLAAPKQSMGEIELRAQLELCISLLNRFRYSNLVTVPDWTADQIIDHGERLNVISRTAHPLGDVIRMAEHEAVLMTYFRNNIQHLFAIPASIACCFIQGRQLEHIELQRLVAMSYPFMKEELRLQWDENSIDEITTAAIEALIQEGILTRDGDYLVRPPAGSAPAVKLMMLGQSMVPMLQRFYLVIALLVRSGSGSLTRAKLENLCQLSAQRLAMIYGLHSPDFFDKALFQDFIRTLREHDVVMRNDAGFLEFGEDIQKIGEDARLVLGEEIRHSILSLTFSGPGFDRI